MAGQGKVTLAVAASLEHEAWSVAYVCIPNTPHVGVVAIPTKQGTSRQRYPDIVAVKDGVLALVEVEMTLTGSVADDIVERFREMRAALQDRETYAMWSEAVSRSCSVDLPTRPTVVCCLVTTRGWRGTAEPFAERLRASGIAVHAFGSFSPGTLMDER